MKMKLLLAVAVFVWTFAFGGTAKAAAPRLDQLVPQGGQRGTEVTVSMRGPRLGLDPKEVLWHESGIEVKNVERVDDNQSKITLHIPEDVHPGRYPLRLRTATGISNVMTFHVGTLPEIEETEPNSNQLEPQTIELGCVVNGLVKREDVDFFTFEAAKGDPISLEVEGLRLGRTFFDPLLVLLDAEGNELARCDDTPLVRQDSCLSLVAPHDGKYVVELRESAYRGNDQATYRLHVGKFPRPLAVYPPGGRVGETVGIQWLGDAMGQTTEQVALPAEATTAFDYYPRSDRGTAPTPHALRVVDMPVTGDVEIEGKPFEPVDAEAPGAFYGVIDKQGDRDNFRFSAKKGQVFYFQMHARSLGSPLDGVMRVLDSKARGLSGNDDNRGHPDSFIRYQVPEDGDYMVQVEDRLLRGGDKYTYWVEATYTQPIVDLSFEEQERYIAKLLDVPRGNRNGVLMRVGRRDFGGEVAIDWTGLPAGVSAELFPVPGNYDRVPVVLSAAKEAPLGQGLATLSAKRTENDSPVEANFTHRNWMVRGRNNVDMWNYTGSQPVVAVTEEAPYSIRIEQSKAPLAQRGTKQLRVIAERKEGFDEAIRVRMLYNPPGVSSNKSLRIKKGETEASIPVTANDKARTGDWHILVRGESEVQGKLVTVTPFAMLSIVEPYVGMQLPRPNVEQGAAIDFTIPVEQRNAFAGQAKVELVGLPPGTSAEPLTMTSETSELKFKITAAADARPGHHRGLFCRVMVMHESEPVVHSVGYGELRVDKPLPAPKVAAQLAK